MLRYLVTALLMLLFLQKRGECFLVEFVCYSYDDEDGECCGR